MEDDDNFSEEYLEGFNAGYSEAEEDLISSNFSAELNEEELNLKFDKGKQEGIKFCQGALGEVLNKFSEIESSDEGKQLLIRNQILAIKYAIDYIHSLKTNKKFTQQPWL
jgi:hypothetical protein